MQEEKTTQQLIEERKKELPKVIQNAIDSSGWERNLRSIISKHNLLIDQGLAIETETVLMMLGLKNPQDYTKNIRKEAGLKKDQAISIATEVDETILKRIKARIITESEREADVESSPLDEVLGIKEELENTLPSIDTNLENEPDDIVTKKIITDDLNRDSLINELEDDIKIDDSFDDEDDGRELINIEQKDIPESLPGENIPEDQKPKVAEEELPKFKTIETNSSADDNLPNLTPIRTLETDTKNIEGGESRKHQKQESVIQKPKPVREEQSPTPQQEMPQAKIPEQNEMPKKPESEQVPSQPEQVPEPQMLQTPAQEPVVPQPTRVETLPPTPPSAPELPMTPVPPIEPVEESQQPESIVPAEPTRPEAHDNVPTGSVPMQRPAPMPEPSILPTPPAPSAPTQMPPAPAPTEQPQAPIPTSPQIPTEQPQAPTQTPPAGGDPYRESVE